MSNGMLKNMVRTAAVLLCGASLTLPAMAQDNTPPPPPSGQQQGPPPQGGGPRGGGRRGGPEQRLKMLTEQLNLTPDQAAKVKAILDNGRAQMEASRGDSSASQEDRRAKMMEMMKSENTQIKAVLTPDQVTKLDALEKQQRERMRENRGGGPGGPGGGTPPPPPPPPAS
jgi:Spy/CpxP family protein refolding chaperone